MRSSVGMARGCHDKCHFLRLKIVSKAIAPEFHEIITAPKKKERLARRRGRGAFSAELSPIGLMDITNGLVGGLSLSGRFLEYM